VGPAVPPPPEISTYPENGKSRLHCPVILWRGGKTPAKDRTGDQNPSFQNPGFGGSPADPRQRLIHWGKSPVTIKRSGKSRTMSSLPKKFLR
jgi:hypothetical protein